MATLKVEKREGVGKYVAFDLRKNGFIPGVLYGKTLEQNVYVTIPLKEFLQVLHKGERLLDLDVDGTNYHTIIKDVQHGTFEHQILHADFRVVSDTETIIVDAEIVCVGEAVGTAEGGMVDQALHHVELEATPRKLPDRVTLDISKLGLNQTLYVADLPALEGVKYRTAKTLPVVSCHAPTAAPEETEGEGAAEGATEPAVIARKKEEED